MRRIILLMLLCAVAGCGQNRLDYGPYSIGRDPSWFPLQLSQHTPNLNAFTNALVQEIAKTEGVPLQIVNIDWVQLFEILENREVAGIFTSLSPNKITQEKYTFSDPFVLLGPVLIVPSDSNVTSLDDLENKIVAVNQFDESILIVQAYPSIYIQLYQSIPAVLEKLAAGEIDGVLMPILDAESLVPSLYPGQLKIVTPPLNDKALRLITLQGFNHSIIKNFNRGLERAVSTGKYTNFRRTYQLD